MADRFIHLTPRWRARNDNTCWCLEELVIGKDKHSTPTQRWTPHWYMPKLTQLVERFLDQVEFDADARTVAELYQRLLEVREEVRATVLASAPQMPVQTTLMRL